MQQGRDMPRRWRLAAPEWGERRRRREDANNGKIVGVLIWSREDGEGEILLAPRFARLHWVERLDALSDWLGLLEREYEVFPGPDKDDEGDGGGEGAGP